MTGAGGMLGRAVVEHLDPMHEVIAWRRSDADLTDYTATQEGIARLAPPVIVHCAAYTDVDGCELDPERALRNNGDATRHVALSAAAIGARVLYVSTDYVFDGRKHGAYGVEDPVAPINVYGRSKLLGETHIREHVPEHWIVRTSWVFGPGGRNFVRTLRRLLLEKPVVKVVNDQVGAPTYTPHLARAIGDLVTSQDSGTFHVTNQGSCSWFEFARAIRERLKGAGELVPCSSSEFPRPAPRPANSCLDATRFLDAGFAALPTWQEALQAYLKYETAALAEPRQPDRGAAMSRRPAGTKPRDGES